MKNMLEPVNIFELKCSREPIPMDLSFLREGGGDLCVMFRNAHVATMHIRGLRVWSEEITTHSVYGKFVESDQHPFTTPGVVDFEFFTDTLAHRRRPHWSPLREHWTKMGIGMSLLEEVSLTRSRATGDCYWLKLPGENLKFQDTIQDWDLEE